MGDDYLRVAVQYLGTSSRLASVLPKTKYGTSVGTY